MPARRRLALKARYVFPVTSQPLADAAVTIRGERIVGVGAAAGDAQLIELGNAAILPGLVNAHTHLEFSDLSAPLGRPGMGFCDWISLIMASRSQRTATPREAIELGLAESAAAGTTTLGEILTEPQLVDAFADPPLDVTLFLELIGLAPERLQQNVDRAEAHLHSAAAQSAWRPGLSPHAPYSLRPELVERAAEMAAARGLPLAMHLAESPEELELLATGGGPFRRQFQEIGVWDDTAVPRGIRVLDFLKLLAPAPHVLVIHGNYLADDEIELLAAQRKRMTVVYCPRTHSYFHHPPHPIARLLAAGARVALGTDSRASSPDLSLLAEMRHVAKVQDALPLARILEIGTLGGAAALGLDNQIGTLEIGKRADLAIVRLPDHDAADPHELLLHASEPVMATIYRGVATYDAAATFSPLPSRERGRG